MKYRTGKSSQLRRYAACEVKGEPSVGSRDSSSPVSSEARSRDYSASHPRGSSHPCLLTFQCGASESDSRRTSGYCGDTRRLHLIRTLFHLGAYCGQPVRQPRSANSFALRPHLDHVRDVAHQRRPWSAADRKPNGSHTACQRRTTLYVGRAGDPTRYALAS